MLLRAATLKTLDPEKLAFNLAVLAILIHYNSLPISILSCTATLSESELFTGDTSKDNHSPSPVIRKASP